MTSDGGLLLAGWVRVWQEAGVAQHRPWEVEGDPRRIRSRRNQCSSAIDCSITQRCTPRPEPCSVARRAMTGVMPFSRALLRYLSWS
jgi:hypothetical protein